MPVIHGVTHCSSHTQFGLAITCLETQCPDMLPHRRLVEVLRSLGFSEPFFPSVESPCVFLWQQRPRLKVSDFAHAFSCSNSVRCGSVTCHVGNEISSQVARWILQADDRTSSVRQRIQLVVAKAERMGSCVEQIMLHVVDLLVLKHPPWSSFNARTQRGGSCRSIRCTSGGHSCQETSQPLELYPTSFTRFAHQASNFLAREPHVRLVLSPTETECAFPEATWVQRRCSCS